MARQAQAAFGFDPGHAFIIGDKKADIDLGRAIGATTILVRTGWGRAAETAGDCSPDTIVDDLSAAVNWIEANT
jgi:D-glycero-D-manno-heptose 1,7-bisphosphate phosphatase